MHSLFQKADVLSREVIAAAIEVHRLKGPGLIESIYEKCLTHEPSVRQIGSVNQRTVRLEYKGFTFDESLRFDLLVENCLLLELKSYAFKRPPTDNGFLTKLIIGGSFLQGALRRWTELGRQRLRFQSARQTFSGEKTQTASSSAWLP